jgi:hypothetical protein
MYLTQDNSPAPERIHNDINGIRTYYAVWKNVFIFLWSKRYELHIWIYCTFNYLTTHSSLTSLSMKVEFVHVTKGSKRLKTVTMSNKSEQWGLQGTLASLDESQWAVAGSTTCSNKARALQEHEAQSCRLSGFHSAVPWEVFWVVTLRHWVSGSDVWENFGAFVFRKKQYKECEWPEMSLLVTV